MARFSFPGLLTKKISRVLHVDNGNDFDVSFDGSDHTNMDALWTALGTLLGTRSATKSGGLPSGTSSVFALLKQIMLQQGLTYLGDITTAASTTTFASTDLIGYENDFFVGWRCFLVRDDGGASAAPQGEWRIVTDYVSTTGTFTIPAFSAAHAVGDQVMLVHPAVYEPIAMRGGPNTIQDIVDTQQAELDFARVQTIASPVTLTAAYQYVYSRAAGSRPFYFTGGFFSQNSGAWATAESVEISVDVMVDGVNWEDMWTAPALVAAAAPLSKAVPSIAPSATLNIPVGFWVMEGNGVRVGIKQSVVGAGYGVWSHSFGDGVPSG